MELFKKTKLVSVCVLKQQVDPLKFGQQWLQEHNENSVVLILIHSVQHSGSIAMFFLFG
jgi:hypothetical protein